MIWAVVTSRSYFCWLCSASPSSAAKHEINLILVLTIWWCPCAESSLVSDFGVDHLVMSMCRVISCVVGRGCLLWPVCSLINKIVSLCLASHFVSKVILQVSLEFLLLPSNPLLWKDLFPVVLILEGALCLCRTSQLQPLWHRCLGHRLGLLWC